ncbi:hypothetical protein MKW94_015391 [Papaver nudicaule]|uniref:Uncharacterized protein n=1 Tax=Papaver nudicaule TaxID=74823 RepID=A0AA41V4N2_PAPNU|nr:hypothetical protein [Papaver nudicaule]
MGTTSKDLLNLELKNSTSSSLDSTLLVFPKKDLPPQNSTCGEKLVTSSIPRSQEAVAAAESAMVGSRQVIDLAGTGNGSDTESSDDDSEDEEMTENGVKDSKPQKTGSSRNGQRKKRPNLIELL